MTSYAAVERFAQGHSRAAIAVGAAADAPAGMTVAGREDGVALSGPRAAERWNTDPRLRAIGDAVRAAAR